MNNDLWFHGTSLYFTSWAIPSGPLKHKGDIAAHSAIFLTTDEEFARLSADGGRGLCSAKIRPSSTLLDMTQASEDESESFRLKVAAKNFGKKKFTRSVSGILGRCLENGCNYEVCTTRT